MAAKAKAEVYGGKDGSSHNNRQQYWWFKSGKQNLLEDSYSFGSSSSTEPEGSRSRWRAMMQQGSYACIAVFERISCQVRDCFGRMKRKPATEELDEIEEIESPKYLARIESQIEKTYDSVKDKVSNFLGGRSLHRQESDRFPFCDYERKSREKYRYISPSPSFENSNSEGTCTPQMQVSDGMKVGLHLSTGKARSPSNERERGREKEKEDSGRQSHQLSTATPQKQSAREEEGGGERNGVADVVKETLLILLSPDTNSNVEMTMSSSSSTNHSDSDNDEFYDAREFQWSDSEREN